MLLIAIVKKVKESLFSQKSGPLEQLFYITSKTPKILHELVKVVLYAPIALIPTQVLGTI